MFISCIFEGSSIGPERAPFGDGTTSCKNSRLWPPEMRNNQVANERNFVARSHWAMGEPFSVPQIFTQAKTFVKCALLFDFLNANFTSAPPLHNDTTMIGLSEWRSSQSRRMAEFSARVPVLRTGTNSHSRFILITACFTTRPSAPESGFCA